MRELLERLKHDPKKALWPVLGIVVVEVVWELAKHAICTWADDRLAEGASPMIGRIALNRIYCARRCRAPLVKRLAYSHGRERGTRIWHHNAGRYRGC
jgi:hypothetical protein